MNCKKCGEYIDDGARYCPYCNERQIEGEAAVPPKPKKPIKTEREINANFQRNPIYCPKCHATGLQNSVEQDFSSSTKTSGGYSGCGACIGFNIFGPIGLLCGNCGGKQKTTTTINNNVRRYWVCNSCGHRFRQVSDLEHELYVELPDAIKSTSFMKNVAMFFLCLTILELIIVLFFTGIPDLWTGLVCFTLPVIAISFWYSLKGKLEELQSTIICRRSELERLKRDMGYEE